MRSGLRGVFAWEGVIPFPGERAVAGDALASQEGELLPEKRLLPQEGELMLGEEWYLPEKGELKLEMH